MKKWLIIAGVATVFGVGAIAGTAFLWPPQEKTEITTETIPAQAEKGKITDGENTASTTTSLQTTTSLTYESPTIKTPKPKSNAAVLEWGQTEGKGEVHLEFRTNNGKKWSDWVDANSPETERPDHAQLIHKAIILADAIHQIQYRYHLSGTDGQPSPQLNLADAKIELIDTTKGPSPTKKNPIKDIFSATGLGQSASAKADGPRVYSRAEWGSPEPEGSPGWDPEYRDLGRIIVHHTATTSPSDPAAMIRAIWHFHTHGNGWGDIGYNYLVDGHGNIYQGRYYDKTYAAVNNKDVVAGHTYGWNYGSVGIAALGSFVGGAEPSENMLRSIGNIGAFRISRYDIHPAAWNGSHPVTIGHSDAVSTGCPMNIHKHLPSIRTFASNEFTAYNRMHHLDFKFIAQGRDGHQTNDFSIKTGDTANLFIDIENNGVDPWRNDGNTPTRLGTTYHTDRFSSFATDGWINPARPASFSYYVQSYKPDGTANLQEVDEILPGQVARFVFPIKAPSVSSHTLFTEHFHPVVDNHSWMLRGSRTWFNIHVDPVNLAWHTTSQRVFTDETKTTEVSPGNTTLYNLRAGQRLYVQAKVQNDGDETWSNSGPNPMRLAATHPRDRSSPVCRPSTWLNNCQRAATMSESTVAPGETATFEFWVEMPYHTDNRVFTEYFNLVQEGVSWAGDRSMGWQFFVDAENLRAHTTHIDIYTSDSKTTPQNVAQLTPNQRFYVVMHIRNDGNVTWRPTGLRHVRLGLTYPRDRDSPFCDSTWVEPTACHRTAVSTESTVPPGQTGTYEFWMKAPSTPGVHFQFFNLVSEGFSWFPTPAQPVITTVN